MPLILLRGVSTNQFNSPLSAQFGLLDRKSGCRRTTGNGLLLLMCLSHFLFLVCYVYAATWLTGVMHYCCSLASFETSSQAYGGKPDGSSPAPVRPRSELDSEPKGAMEFSTTSVCYSSHPLTCRGARIAPSQRPTHLPSANLARS